jgi:hypothetical protein
MKFLRHLLGITKLDKKKRISVLGEKREYRNFFIYLFILFFNPMPPRVLMDFMVFSPGHGSSVTDF